MFFVEYADNCVSSSKVYSVPSLQVTVVPAAIVTSLSGQSLLLIVVTMP